jgi:UDP-N-acetylglucosamine 2-epimerase (non-hydrolysing)
MKIISVVGARPNFMKVAPFIRAIHKYNSDLGYPGSGGPEGSITHILVHTGQHYDDRMSKSFFDQLDIPEADINLGVGSGTHAEQVGKTMIEFEKVLRSENPDWVVVFGDVNAILACSVTAKKEKIKCCHIEAGLRSGDITMPEEINRLVADRISDLLLTPDTIASENLRKEGVSNEKIKFVGNIMIDTLEAFRNKAESLDLKNILRENSVNGTWKKYDLTPSTEMAVITIHRPSNVDKESALRPIVHFLINEVCEDLPLIWPVHPRTRKMLEKFSLWDEVFNRKNLFLLNPVGYLEMLKLNMQCRIMLTDSGGLQEECTLLGTPCLTLRLNTERPVTLTEAGGTCILVGNEIERIRKQYNLNKKNDRIPVRPNLWDGSTSKRCLDAILNYRP